jgi:hypothetical protein
MVQGPIGAYSVATPKQLVDSDLFHQFLMTLVEYGGETSSIGKVLSLYFHPYR